jgi:hypothetical protein
VNIKWASSNRFLSLVCPVFQTRSLEAPEAAATAQLLDGHAGFSLFEKADDLFIGKPRDLHIRDSPEFTDYLPIPWYG